MLPHLKLQPCISIPNNVTVSLPRDSFKIATNYNNAGRFNCLRQPGQILHTPNVYHAICTHLLYFLHREQFCIRDKVYGAVGRRASCHGFCIAICQFLHREQSAPFIGTQSSWPFIMTAKSSPLIGTMQKHMPTLTRTATKSTSGPLCVRYWTYDS